MRVAAYRWEKERAAWLLSHSRPGTTLRRQAELLKRRAGRAAQRAAGAPTSGLHEDVTPSLMRRLMTTDDGAGEQLVRLVGVPLLAGLIGLAIGPAIVIGVAIYAVLWQRSPRIGRLWAWPWLLVAVAVGALTYWLTRESGIGLWAAPWSATVHVYPPAFIPVWLGSQLTLGLLLVPVLIAATGWAAVPRRAGLGKTGPQKNADGTFKRIEDKDLVVLEPYTAPTSTPTTTADDEHAVITPLTDGEDPFVVFTTGEQHD